MRAASYKQQLTRRRGRLKQRKRVIQFFSGKLLLGLFCIFFENQTLTKALAFSLLPGVSLPSSTLFSSSTTEKPSSVLSLDPSVIELVPYSNTVNATFQKQQQQSFLSTFRSSAGYMAHHRHSTMICHLPASLFEDSSKELFHKCVHDLALTWLLGVHLVLVIGRDTTSTTVQPTTKQQLQSLQQTAGYHRFELERSLTKAFGHNGRIPSIVSGNFVSAQPTGILNGTDYLYTGTCRSIKAQKVRELLLHDHSIVLLHSLGVSPSGEVYALAHSQQLAAMVARQLEAQKVVLLLEPPVMTLRHMTHGTMIQSLRLRDAKALLVEQQQNEKQDRTTAAFSFFQTLHWATQALQGVSSVRRAHLCAPDAILEELYTRDGSGILISRDLYEDVRPARVTDVSAMYDLIHPLVQTGTLVERTKAMLERDVDTYQVMTRDDALMACGQVTYYPNSHAAELGCLVVNKDYRQAGRGDAMLGYMERLCLTRNISQVFVLSTQTMEWFLERGFYLVPVEHLPPERLETYNWQRASKVYWKTIDGDRDLDASEMRWNR